MSALSEQTRAKAKAKVERLTRSSNGKVDASGWKEPLGQQANVQTGERPVSRRNFKRGGKVAGLAPAHHAGRKPRASGGMTTDEYMNRNVKSANEKREGPKHVGGMKHGGSCTCAKCGGGKVGKAAGGGLKNEYDANYALRVAAQRNKPDAEAIQKMKGTASDRMHPRMAEPKRMSGKAAGGTVSDGKLEGTRPKGGRLARKHGGRSKKGTNINIIIAPGGGGPRPAAAPPGLVPPPRPVGMGMPPGGPPPGGAPPPMGPPGGGMPPPGLMRKSGGRVEGQPANKLGKYPIKDGAGGAKGRLEKARAYG